MAPPVFDEVKDEGIRKWLKEKKLTSSIQVPVDQIDQNKVRALVPRLVDPITGKSSADPWVIALAQSFQNCAVVTQEKFSSNENKPKIPDVCQDLGIECIELATLIGRENLDPPDGI